MAGPWEKYKKADTPEGPWSRFQNKKDAAYYEPSGRVGPVVRETAGDMMRSGSSGIARGFTSLLDLPANLPGLLAQGGSWVGEKTGLLDPQKAQDFRGALNEFRQYGGATEAATNLAPEVMNYKPTTTLGEFSQTVGEFMPGMALGGTAPQMVAAGLASEAGGQLTEGTDYETPVRIGAGIVGGVGGGLVDDMLGRTRASNRYIKGAKPTEDLSAEAAALYRAGHARNIKIKPNTTRQFRDALWKMAQDKGYISPSGKVVENASLKQVFNLLDDYTNGPVTTKQLQAVRRQISDIAGSKDPIAPLGMEMKGAYDNFLAQFAPEFKKANEINFRANLSKRMDKAGDKIEDKTTQFSQSGEENATRTVFRGINADIREGRIKGLRPDQVEAVRKAARGTPASNTARNVGRMAPKGPISFGMPFLTGGTIGALTGNPQLGMLAASGQAGAGIIGHLLASNMTRRAAQEASASMRQPAPLQLPPYRVAPQGLLPGLTSQR